jgi:Fe-S-cluster containining protein
MTRTDLSAAVAAAADRSDVSAAIAGVYTRIEAAVATRRPLCVISGRCCRFDEFGHRLYVTTMELAVFVKELRAASASAAAAEANAGGCPFQRNRLCGVHGIRPMGCRLFFCDETSTQWQRKQYEQMHAQLKRLHESLAVPYFYVEWRSALTALGLNQP